MRQECGESVAQRKKVEGGLKYLNLKNLKISGIKMMSLPAGRG